MKRMFSHSIFRASLLTAVAVSSVLAGQLRAQGNKPEAPMKLKVGDVAPEFKLKYFDGSGLKDVSLSDYRGKKNVVVAFYVFAFTDG